MQSYCIGQKIHSGYCIPSREDPNDILFGQPNAMLAPFPLACGHVVAIKAK